MTCRYLVLALGLGGIAAPAARADGNIDMVEHFFGATNVHAIAGHGGLTVGVTRDGELSVLVWPNPSYVDQLAYLTSNAWEARSLPRFGASEGAGAFEGLLLERGDGTREVAWLRGGGPWTIAQSYGPADGPSPTTTFSSADLGLSVTIVDAVAPDADLLVRAVRVERAAGSPVARAWLLSYLNLSPTPTESRLPEVPVIDWLFDGRNDFAAVWDETAGAVVHFHPREGGIVRDQVGDLLASLEADYGAIGDALRAGTPDAAAAASLVASLDAFGAGSWFAFTTVPPPDQHQIGFDATPLCDDVDEFADALIALPERLPMGAALPIDPSVANGVRCNRTLPPIAEREAWTAVAADAWTDAADGELAGSHVAAGEVNAALRTPLTFDAGGVATAHLALGAGATNAEARAALAAEPAGGVPAAAEAALDAWLADLRMPAVGPPDVLRVARRALINVRVGTADTGAVVASISRQAPYGLDWPRDGAFFDVLLDVSGQTELVTRRAALYDSWQRKRDVAPTPIVDPLPPPNPDGSRRGTYPAGAWEMNYYADGMIGGLWRFEIDETAFAVWTIVAHAGWLPEGEREPYLRERWSAIELGTELLATWRDPETGLQARAQEDDNAPYTQTLHGAVTVFGALDIASRAARLLGETDAAARWEDRAAELRDAILTHLYDEDARRFVTQGEIFNPGSAPTGPTAWLVWPMRLLPWDDARVGEQLLADLATIEPTIRLENEGGAYYMKNTVSLAVARGGDPVLGPRLAELRDLVAGHATDTDHFGEVMVVVDGRADQRVSSPHLWEGTLFYLTAMALEDPAALMQWDVALPPSEVPAPFTRRPPAIGDPAGGGCCAIAPGAGGHPRALLVLAILGGAVVARRVLRARR